MGFVAFPPEFWYNQQMSANEKPLSEEQVAAARDRRRVAMHLQAIEGSPATPEQVRMFEMFERERWSHERRLAYIKERAARAGAAHAAE